MVGEYGSGTDFMLCCLLATCLYMPAKRTRVIAVILLAVTCFAFALFALGWTLVTRAFLESLSAINQTIGGALYAVVVAVGVLIVEWPKYKKSGIVQKVFQIVGATVFVALGVWFLVFLFTAFIGLRLEVNREARRVSAPTVPDKLKYVTHPPDRIPVLKGRSSPRMAICRVDDLEKCTPKELRDNALFLSRQINNVYLQARSVVRRVKHNLFSADTEQTRQDIQNAGGAIVRASDQMAVRDYINDYRPAAELYRQALLRIVIGHRNETMDYFYFNPLVAENVGSVATDLHDLADAVHVVEPLKEPDDIVAVLSKLADEGLRYVQRSCRADQFSEWQNTVSAIINSRVPQYTRDFATYRAECPYADAQLTALEGIIDKVIKDEKRE